MERSPLRCRVLLPAGRGRFGEVDWPVLVSGGFYQLVYDDGRWSEDLVE